MSEARAIRRRKPSCFQDAVGVVAELRRGEHIRQLDRAQRRPSRKSDGAPDMTGTIEIGYALPRERVCVGDRLSDTVYW